MLIFMNFMLALSLRSQSALCAPQAKAGRKKDLCT